MRPHHLVLAAVAVLAVAGLALSACSGDDDAPEAAGERRTTTTTAAPDLAAEVSLTRGETVVASAGGDVILDEVTQQAVVDAAQAYVDAAVVAPLNEGEVGEGYDTLFDSTVLASAVEADRSVLTDEGIPAPTESPSVTATPVRIDALAAPDGSITFLATSFNLDIAAETASGPVAVRRNTELTFAATPEGDWLVTAYRVNVERDLPQARTSTTTAVAG
jgi:hypothetical protein